MAIDYGLLGTMPQDQAIAYLMQQYGQGGASPLGSAPLTGMPGYVAPATGEGDYGITPTAGSGQWLTPDATYNGQEGAYVGRFDNGQLQNVYFDPKEAYGFADQWGGPLAIAGAALGGAMLNGGFGAGTGAMTDAGVNAAIAGGMEAPIAGGAGGAGMGAAGTGAAAGGGGLLSGIGGALGGAQGIGALAGAALGGLSAATAPDSETVERRPYIDPRVDAMLMGQNGQPGLMQDLIGMGKAPLPAGMQSASGAANDWLTNQYGQNTATMQNAIARQMQGLSAPTMSGALIGAANAGGAAQAGGIGGAKSASASRAGTAQINAPGQNTIGLSQGFDDYIYGDQAQNKYLHGALQRGADQSRYNFQNLLGDMGQRFQEDVMGGIRGGAIMAGGLGGSRQGIAEGIAAREYAKQASRAAGQVGQDLNSAMIGAQSDQFTQGRNLGANLLGNLSGQQYGVATNQANLGQSANNLNAQLGTQASIANAGNATNMAGVKANLGIANMNAANQMAQFNAGLLQQANLANQASQNLAGTNNLGAQLGTNTLNANTLQQGVGNAGNLANSQYNLANNAYQMPLNQFSQAMQTAQPSFGMYGSGSNTTTPLYNNPWASVLGGAMAGAQLGNVWGK